MGVTYKTSVYATFFPCKGSVWSGAPARETAGNLNGDLLDPACSPDRAAVDAYLSGSVDAYTASYLTGKKKRAGLDYTPGSPRDGFDIAVLFLDGQVAAPSVVADEIAAKMEGIPWVAGESSRLAEREHNPIWVHHSGGSCPLLRAFPQLLSPHHGSLLPHPVFLGCGLLSP